MASETKELHEARLRLRGVVTAIAVKGSSDELMEAMLAAEQRLIAAARTPPPEDGGRRDATVSVRFVDLLGSPRT